MGDIHLNCVQDEALMSERQHCNKWIGMLVIRNTGDIGIVEYRFILEVAYDEDVIKGSPTRSSLMPLSPPPTATFT